MQAMEMTGSEHDLKRYGDGTLLPDCSAYTAAVLLMLVEAYKA